MQITAIAALVAGLLGSGLGYWVGANLESGACAHAKLAVATRYAEGWVAAADAARADATATARAESSAMRRQEQTLSRVAALDRDAARLPARPDCDWTADELRLARARHCTHYPTDAPCILPDGLPTPTDAHQPPGDVGSADRGLGLRLPAAPRLLHPLGATAH